MTNSKGTNRGKIIAAVSAAVVTAIIAPLFLDWVKPKPADHYYSVEIENPGEGIRVYANAIPQDSDEVIVLIDTRGVIPNDSEYSFDVTEENVGRGKYTLEIRVDYIGWNTTKMIPIKVTLHTKYDDKEKASTALPFRLFRIGSVPYGTEKFEIEF